MKKLSNAQQIRSLYKELLEDGKEHSRSELFEYIESKSSSKYTLGMMTGALKTLVSDSEDYQNTGRGYYKKIVKEKPKSKKISIVDYYIEIFQDTLKRCEDIRTNPFTVIKLCQEEQKKMLEIEKCLDNIKLIVNQSE